MANKPTEVSQDSGNLNEGLEYERKVLLFIAASLSQNEEVKDFWIVSNPTGVGKIDDVVVRISFEDSRKKDIALFVQVKHTTPDKSLWLKLNDNDRRPPQKCYPIKLAEYEASFEDLTKMMSSDRPKPETALQTLLMGVDVKDYFACIFTNMKNVYPILQCIIQVDKDHEIYFLDTLNRGQYQQFDYVNDVRFNRNFYKQLYVFLGQPMHKDMDKAIAQVLGENSKKMPYLDKVMKDFMQRDSFCGVLTKQEFELKLCEVVVNYWLVEEKKIAVIIEKYAELWNKIFSGEAIINLCDNNVAALLAYHYQCVIRKEVDEHFNWQVGVTQLTQTTKDCIQQKYSKNVTDVNDLLFLLWRENKIPLAIKSEYTSNILDFLQKFNTLKRRFVIFCSEDSPELKEYSSKESVITYVREITDKETLEKVFDLEVSLQGRRPVALSEISGVSIEAAVEGIYKDLPISQVLTWTEERKNIQHIIGHELPPLVDNYITRNFTQKGEKHKKLTENDVLRLVRPGLHIITGDPGMGKSTVLNALAHRYLSRNFLIYVKLRDCLDDIENSAILKVIKSDPLKFFFSKMTSNSDDKIVKSIMEVHRTCKRLCLFLDAFDEILPLHERKIISLMTTILENTDVPIFCTTRPHAEEKLTRIAGSISFILLPFDYEQIFEYFTKTNINRNILWTLGYEFLRNPLHLHMMSAIYQDHENSDSITREEMYNLFIEIKHKTYNKKMNLSQNVAHLSIVKSMKQHRELALVEIFGEEDVISKGLTSDTGLAEALKDICDQNIGIVDVRNSKKSFQFVHRTFAEYFVADFLLNIIVQSVLNTEKFKPFYKAVWEKYETYRDIKHMIEERTRRRDLWFEARKYLFINSANNNKTRHSLVNGRSQCHKKIIAIPNKIASVWRWLIKSPPCTCDGFLGWLECTVSHSNVNGSTIVHSINMDYPTRTRLTEDDGDTCVKLLTAIHAENEEDVESNVARPLLETGMGIVAFNLAVTTGNESIVKILLDLRPTLVDEQDVNGNTGLHISCAMGYSTIAGLLFDHCANFDIRNNKDTTPLGMATRNKQWGIWKIKHIGEISKRLREDGHASSVKYFSLDLLDVFNGLCTYYEDICLEDVKHLLGYVVDPSISDDNGCTLLHGAAEGGNPDIIDMLVKIGFNINKKTKKGETPFDICLKKKAYGGILVLLINGAEPPLTDDDGETLMHRAASAKLFGLEIIKILSSRGFNINEKTNDGKTPLTIACEEQRWDIARWLKEHGADPTVSDENGWTSIHFAVKGGDKEIIEMLWDRGINVNEKTNDGKTPLTIACGRRWDIAKWLMEHGADPTASDKNGWSCIHFAARGNDIEIIEMLLDRGINVNEKTNDGKTPLTIACSELSKSNIVKCLLEHHADPTIADKDGWTSMHFAATKPCYYFLEAIKLETIKVLLDKRLNVNIKTKDGQTPLAIARSDEWTDMVELLLAHGAVES